MTAVKKTVGSVLLIIGMLLIFGICCLSVSSSASAEGSSSLTLICMENNKVCGSMPWSIYRVGSLVDGKIQAEGEFAKYPVVLDNMTASGLADAASTLKEYAFLYNIPVTAKGVTKNDGTLKFDGLQDGVYLIAAKKCKNGSKTYIPTPALVEVNSAKDPDMVVYPKIKSILTLADGYERFTVMKIWENTDNMPLKPTEIVVDIYCDYEFYQTVTLSVDNDWKYSWEELEGSEWTIIERKIPEKCTVIYRNDGKRYVVVNTYTPLFVFDWSSDFPPPPKTTDKATGTVIADTETTATAVVSAPVGGSEATGTKDTVVADETATIPEGSSTEEAENTTTASGEATGTNPVASGSVTTPESGTTPNGGTTPEGGTTPVGNITSPVGSSSTPEGSGTIPVGSETTPDGTTPVDGTKPVDEGGDVEEDSTKPHDEGGDTSDDSDNEDSTKPVYTVRATTPTTENKLPQTGQLWWPVPVMAMLGLVLIASGIRMITGSKREDNE